MRIRKCLALLLVMFMIISSLPISVFAEEVSENTVINTGQNESEEKISDDRKEAEEALNSDSAKDDSQETPEEEPVLTTTAAPTSDGTYMYNVPYVDVDRHGNKTTKICKKATIINNNDYSEYKLVDQWYVVSQNASFKRYEINADVHIILMDGSTMESTHGGVEIYSGSLAIYGQEAQTGKLIAMSTNKKQAGIDVRGGSLTINGGNIEATGGSLRAYGSAGIGGENGETGSNITINYGTVIATGGTGSAGIGGGNDAQGNNITINGGNVTATGGGIIEGNYTYTVYGGGAGIGGGEDSTGQNITINGGTVKAYGTDGGAGIGGGESGKGSNITITGGTVYARGRGGGSGIGGGYDRHGENITITGGNVTAVGSNQAAGIGGGGKEENEGENIKITGGTVKATGGTYGSGIGGGYKGDAKNISITGGTVTSKGASGGAGIGGGCGGDGTEISISGGTINAVGGPAGAGIGGGDDGTGSSIKITGGDIEADATAGDGNAIGGGKNGSSSGIYVNHYMVIHTSYKYGSYEASDVDIPKNADMSSKLTGKKYLHVLKLPEITYEDFVDGAYVEKTVTDYRSITADTKVLDDDLYVLYQDLTLDHSLEIKGDVKLVLYGHTLKITNVADGQAGIQITNSDPENPENHLTICTGGLDYRCNLEVTGGKNAAGIGGGIDQKGSYITINGGNITATGGENGAGIGGGKNGSGRMITINGGTIIAKGGENGAGIGGGDHGIGRDIVINKGTTIQSTGGKNGAGIGGGNKNNGEGITINDGNVSAQGGSGGAGIGGGYEGMSHSITINNGVIKATGGAEACGIGGGESGHCYDLVIHHGVISASGGSKNISGIGGGKSQITSGVTIDTCCEIKADDQNPPQTVIDNTGKDLSNALDGKQYVSIKDGIAADYLDAEGQLQSVVATPIFETMTELKNGWYVVDKDIQLSQQLNVSGNVHLILMDGCTLNFAIRKSVAIRVTNDDPEHPENTLTIYGQSNGTGKLEAYGYGGGAGIGGNTNENGSWITINGGIIEAESQHEGGAGIGGGRNGNGSHITINGGHITAIGREGGTGIGGGKDKSGTDITINGGTVIAEGAFLSGAGIGGSGSGEGSRITINGGEVTATGGHDYGAGIGGGSKGTDITINGGHVSATGGINSAGIGGGGYYYRYSDDAENITINGGEITATGGQYAAAIGGGKKGTGKNITINGGKVTAIAGENASAIGGGQEGTGKNIVVAPYLAVKAGNGEDAATYMTNVGEDLSSKLEGISFVQTQNFITVDKNEVLIYDQTAENSVVKATVPAKVYYTGKAQSSSIMKPSYLAETYEDIMTKSEDYQTKADAATPLSDLIKNVKRIYINLDGTAKKLLGTSSPAMLMSALNTTNDGINGLKGTYYGNLNTDLWSSITLNNGEFNTDENANNIDTALRNIYTADTDGKSVITGEVTRTYGDAFYNSLIATGDLYIKSFSIDKDIFMLYEGSKAYIVNFNSETLEDRATFNEAAMNTYESGYLLVNTAMAYDMQNHINQLNIIVALQAAAASDQYSSAEKTAIKKEISDLENTLGMSLSEAKAQHEKYVAADKEKIDILNTQYKNIRSLWQTSDERLQEDQALVAGYVVHCYRNDKYYDYDLKVANVNDGVPNADSTNISDFLVSNSNGYLAEVRSIYLQGDRGYENTPFTDAASVDDLISMQTWAKERKTNINEEIAKAFIIEDNEIVSAQENDNCLGIYYNGVQRASKADNTLSFSRTVGYFQNGSVKGKETLMRSWRASDGALRQSQTDIDSTVLVLSDANLGGNWEDDGNGNDIISTGNITTGIHGDDQWAIILSVCLIFIGCVICVCVGKRKVKRQ